MNTKAQGNRFATNDEIVSNSASQPFRDRYASLTNEHQRLVDLIEFAQQTTKLLTKPAASITQQSAFFLHEHSLLGLPGVKLNIETDSDEEDIWLAVERLNATMPPENGSALLKPWIQISPNPNERPRLLESIEGEDLIAAGTHRSSLKTIVPEEDKDKEPIHPRKTVLLAEYLRQNHVKAYFKKYVEARWEPWSTEEQLRRQTIKLYAQLFTLKQQLDGSIVESALELAWGVGVGVWNCNGTHVCYPIITRLAELTLNEKTATIEIRPRDTDPQVEIDWYSSVDNLGVADLEKKAKAFFSSLSQTLTPFDPDTYQPLLRTAVTYLDKHGVYWPDIVSPNNRSLPKEDEHLKVTDTWVIFARPRTNNIFLQDLDNFKAVLLDSKSDINLPPAVAAVVTDPDTTNDVIELPSFRGVSATCSTSSGSGSTKARDLFFPKPFNDEQVRIIQMLEVSDGVVVQGPPGTGKTHTIANVICHYLAEGKRVLVTSLKDPALAVLQNQLPAEIKPLAIALLSSEQEGMKQFEFAIHKIASEIQSLDRTSIAKSIENLERVIDTLHAKLALTDTKITTWAQRNIETITLDGETVAPQDAALEIVAHEEAYESFPDKLHIDPQFNPQFTKQDIIEVREARRALGQDIDYLNAVLPLPTEFPEPKTLLQVHGDLSRFEQLKVSIESGEIPELANSDQATISEAQSMLADIADLRSLREEITQAKISWAPKMRDHIIKGLNPVLIQLLDQLGEQLEKALKKREQFLQRPVEVPDAAELDVALVESVYNLSQGRHAFGLKGLFGMTEQKKLLESMLIVGARPNTHDDWTHIHKFLALQKEFRELAVRWNTIAKELKIDALDGATPEHGITAAAAFRLYKTIKHLVRVEIKLRDIAVRVFPSWQAVRAVYDNPDTLSALELAIQHHLTKNRLANVWDTKERFQKILHGRNGRIVASIRSFFNNQLGNPEVSDTQLQGLWSNHMTELERVLALNPYLKTVRDVCVKFQKSGAPFFAELLGKPVTGVVDELLPDNFFQVWRFRRLATYLEEIDAQEEMRRLSKTRHGLEADLAKAYRDIVVQRTWLKLAEKASPGVRAALMAYLKAIQKIGKGTGKRAVRYRQDARNAASQANSAVPCWIMPHYRISEALPCELGCFDLVIIDEASQSDLTALPALLRANKLLIVGDDKQVSPEGIGFEEAKLQNLMKRFLSNQVVTYRSQMSPVSSIYDLFHVVFAKSSVMLKEHFRCVGPIIEYSKREFYNHELLPLRRPTRKERIDPPLVDVFVEDGYRSAGDCNLSEARFIVEEIRSIIVDPKFANRTIGVVSLLADKQAHRIWTMLTDEIGPELMEKHHIACGDARTFQGKERDIMFLSMVSSPNDGGAALTRDTFAQRFNVAASRAKDRMYLVRSINIEHLSPADKLRRNLITHFCAPYAQDEERVKEQRNLCESDFERDIYDELTQRGYWITPQVRVGRFRIDLVAEGNNDARLAIECDGDRYHGPDRWADDMQRQRILERAGWVFWRCFASTYVRRKHEILAELVRNLELLGIEPIGPDSVPRSIHAEQRVYRATRDEPAEEPSETLPEDAMDGVEEDTTAAIGARTIYGRDGNRIAEGRDFSRHIRAEYQFDRTTHDEPIEQTYLNLSDAAAGEGDEDATTAVGTRVGTAYGGNRNGEGRDCSRRIAWRGYFIPRVRPPRGMATPEGFHASRWMEREGQGCPTYCVRDAFNVNQVRTKGINHTSMRSLCVAGVALAERGEGDFDPAAHHFFIIEGEHTFIVW